MIVSMSVLKSSNCFCTISKPNYIFLLKYKAYPVVIRRIEDKDCEFVKSESYQVFDSGFRYSV